MEGRLKLNWATTRQRWLELRRLRVGGIAWRGSPQPRNNKRCPARAREYIAMPLLTQMNGYMCVCVNVCTSVNKCVYVCVCVWIMWKSTLQALSQSVSQSTVLTTRHSATTYYESYNTQWAKREPKHNLSQTNTDNNYPYRIAYKNPTQTPHNTSKHKPRNTHTYNPTKTKCTRHASRAIPQDQIAMQIPIHPRNASRRNGHVFVPHTQMYEWVCCHQNIVYLPLIWWWYGMTQHSTAQVRLGFCCSAALLCLCPKHPCSID